MGGFNRRDVSPCMKVRIKNLIGEVFLPQYTVGVVQLFSLRSCYFNWLGVASKLDNPNPLGFADRAEGKYGWSRLLGFSWLRSPGEFRGVHN